jgi:hypothetical protein
MEHLHLGLWRTSESMMISERDHGIGFERHIVKGSAANHLDAVDQFFLA